MYYEAQETLILQATVVIFGECIHYRYIKEKNCVKKLEAMFPSSNLYAKENLYSLICTLLRLK
jgi:hypothetical protein